MDFAAFGDLINGGSVFVNAGLLWIIWRLDRRQSATDVNVSQHGIRILTLESKV